MKIRWFEISVILFVTIAIGLGLYLRTPSGPIYPSIPQHPTETRRLGLPTFTLPVDADQPLHIGIFGESRSDGIKNEAFNDAVLTKLFAVMQKKQVTAIFDTGNLVSGLAEEADSKAKVPNGRALKEQLEAFSHLYEDVFGTKVPFFPVMGNHELAVPHGEVIFREHFHLKHSVQLDPQGMGYTVAMGNAFFAVIASGSEQAGRGGKPGQLFNPALLTWLQKVLGDASIGYDNLFVVGYEPIFPIDTTFIDSHAGEREQFWRILVTNKVLAYFCSHEHLFDRSERHGVWQVISGGGGAPLREGGGSKPFFHCLLLTIPADKQKPPSIEVLDVDGKAIDAFELVPANSVIHQRHIS